MHIGVRRIRISEKFRVFGSVDLISRSGLVASGYPDFGYPCKYYITYGIRIKIRKIIKIKNIF